MEAQPQSFKACFALCGMTVIVGVVNNTEQWKNSSSIESQDPCYKYI